MSWSSDGYDAGVLCSHLFHSGHLSSHRRPILIFYTVQREGRGGTSNCNTKIFSPQTSMSLATDYHGSARTSCLDRKRAGAGSDACLPGRH